MNESTQQIITRIIAKEFDVAEDEILDKLFQEGVQHYDGDSYWEEEFFAKHYVIGYISGYRKFLCNHDDEMLAKMYGLTAEEIKQLRETESEDEE